MSANRIALILGNGPSLLKLDPALLEALPSFGCNFVPYPVTYYTCIDAHLLQEHADELYDRASHAQIVYLSSKFEGSSKLYDLPYVRLVSKDEGPFQAERFMTGLTATYVNLKMAYYLGFEKVVLYGVDHSLAWDHYSPGYHVAVTPPSVDRLKLMEWHYALAARVYARAGREIVNCSNPSTLDKWFRRQPTNEKETLA